MRPLGILVLTVLLLLIRAIVFSMLWSWFVAPVFHLPALTVGAACGLMILAAVFLPGWETNWNEQSDGQKMDWFIQSMAINEVALGMGWVVHLFM